MYVQDAMYQFLSQYDLVTKEGQTIQANSAKFTITGAANNGSGLIRITASGHGLKTGDRAFIASVNGTVEANNSPSNTSWPVTWVSSSTFDLIGSTFTNAFTSSPGAYGVGALVGTVDSDKLTKEQQLYYYNMARMALVEGARRVAAGNPVQMETIIGGSIVTDALTWTRTGMKSIATRPVGIIKLFGITSHTGAQVVVRGHNDLAKVLRGDSHFLQSDDVVYAFDEGAQYVHHGNYLPSNPATAITGATNTAPIIVSASGHGILTGQFVRMANVGGNLGANGDFKATVLTSATFSLDGSVGTSSWTSGGTFQKLYRIAYLGVTNWTLLSDVYLGASVETIREAQVPILAQLAVAAAKGTQGAQLGELAAQMIGGKQ